MQHSNLFPQFGASLLWKSMHVGRAVLLATRMAIEKCSFHCGCFLQPVISVRSGHFVSTHLTCPPKSVLPCVYSPQSLTSNSILQSQLSHELNTLGSAQQAAFHPRDAFPAVHEENVVIESVLGVLQPNARVPDLPHCWRRAPCLSL